MAAKFFISYAEPIFPFPDVRISHIAIDRAHTTAKDMASYFPLAAMLRLADAVISAQFRRIFRFTNKSVAACHQANRLPPIIITLSVG